MNITGVTKRELVGAKSLSLRFLQLLARQFPELRI